MVIFQFCELYDSLLKIELNTLPPIREKVALDALVSSESRNFKEKEGDDDSVSSTESAPANNQKTTSPGAHKVGAQRIGSAANEWH